MIKITKSFKKLTKTIPLIKRYNEKKIKAILSLLPVREKDIQEINNSLTQYLKAITVINQNNLKCELTVKLQQFGLYNNPDFTLQIIKTLVKQAEKHNIFVWIDQEKKELVAPSINIFKQLNSKNTGICIQAYHKESFEQMKELLKNKVKIRLVKGFYNDNDFKTWNEVTDNYQQMMRYLLDNSDIGCIATHDKKLIEEASKIILRKKLWKSEIQSFAGVHDEYIEELAKKSINTSLYITWGNKFNFLIKGFKIFDKKRTIKRILHLKVS